MFSFRVYWNLCFQTLLNCIFALALQIKLGTVDQDEAQIEWVSRPYMNTAKKQKYIGEWDNCLAFTLVIRVLVYQVLIFVWVSFLTFTFFSPSSQIFSCKLWKKKKKFVFYILEECHFLLWTLVQFHLFFMHFNMAYSVSVHCLKRSSKQLLPYKLWMILSLVY